MQGFVYIATSVDGFIARKDGSLDWLPQPDPSSTEDFGYHAFTSRMQALVMGRHTLETVLGFGQWPYELPVWVLSQSLTQLPPGLPDSVHLHPGPPAALAQELARLGIQRAWVDGGRCIQSFLAAGLIQELILTRIPVLLGEGLPLFGPLAQDQALELVEQISWPNGFTQCHYRIFPSPPTSEK